MHAPYRLPRNPSLTPCSLHSFEIALHSVLACRLMIGIREATQSFGRKSDTFELSEVFRDDAIEFAHRSSEGESA